MTTKKHDNQYEFTEAIRSNLGKFADLDGIGRAILLFMSGTVFINRSGYLAKLSRYKIVKETGFKKPTVNDRITKMIEYGYLEEHDDGFLMDDDRIYSIINDEITPTKSITRGNKSLSNPRGTNQHFTGKRKSQSEQVVTPTEAPTESASTPAGAGWDSLKPLCISLTESGILHTVKRRGESRIYVYGNNKSLSMPFSKPEEAKQFLESLGG